VPVDTEHARDRGRESEQSHRLVRHAARTGRARAHGVPIISDEVFLDYPLEGSGTTFVRDDVLTFTLGGLSKSAGLPHFKLGWIRVSGPAKREALDALELIADNFLSVATPVQVALPEILRSRRGSATRSATHAPNLDTLRMPCELRPRAPAGGRRLVGRAPRAAHAVRRRARAGAPRSRRRRAAGLFFDFAQEGISCCRC
jgi:hypothetical protein